MRGPTSRANWTNRTHRSSGRALQRREKQRGCSGPLPASRPGSRPGGPRRISQMAASPRPPTGRRGSAPRLGRESGADRSHQRTDGPARDPATARKRPQVRDTGGWPESTGSRWSVPRHRRIEPSDRSRPPAPRHDRHPLPRVTPRRSSASQLPHGRDLRRETPSGRRARWSRRRPSAIRRRRRRAPSHRSEARPEDLEP